MRRRGSGLAGTVVLAVLTLALAAGAAWQVAAPGDPAPTRMPPRAGAGADPLPVAAGGGEGTRDTSAVTERPLFARTRRLPAPIAAAVAAEAPPPPPPPPLDQRYKLLGITRVEGATTALLREVAGGRILRLRTGEAIGSWTLVGLADRRTLRFAQGTEQQVLVLEGRATRSGPAPLVMSNGSRRPGGDDDDDDDEPPPPSARR